METLGLGHLGRFSTTLEPMVNAFMTLVHEVRKTRDILTPALRKFGWKAKTTKTDFSFTCGKLVAPDCLKKRIKPMKWIPVSSVRT